MRTLDRVRAWAADGERDTSPLFAALADRASAPDALLPATGVPLDWERMLSAPFIVSERYGTRCSTLLTIDCDRRARFQERSFAADGAQVAETIEEFDLL